MEATLDAAIEHAFAHDIWSNFNRDDMDVWRAHIVGAIALRMETGSSSSSLSSKPITLQTLHGLLGMDIPNIFACLYLGLHSEILRALPIGDLLYSDVFDFNHSDRSKKDRYTALREELPTIARQVLGTLDIAGQAAWDTYRSRWDDILTSMAEERYAHGNPFGAEGSDEENGDGDENEASDNESVQHDDGPPPPKRVKLDRRQSGVEKPSSRQNI